MNNTRRSFRPFLAVLPFALAACASTVSPDDEPPVDENPAAAVPADAPAAAPAAESAARPAPPVTGEVVLSQRDPGEEGGYTVVSADFWATGGRETSPGCVTERVEGCEVRRCSAGLESVTPDAAARTVDRLSIDGLTTDPLSLTPRSLAGLPEHYGWYAPDPSWLGGERVTLSGGGSDEVAAFSLTATTPAVLRVTSGSLDQTRLSRDAGDVGVTWEPAPGATVRLQFGGARDQQQETVRVRCEFPGGLGRGAVPAAAVASLLPGPTSFSVVSTVTERSVSDGLALSVELKHFARVDRVTFD